MMPQLPPGSRPPCSARAHGVGQILGEERLGLRAARDVHALRVPGRRHRGPQHHQDHRPHPARPRQLQRPYADSASLSTSASTRYPGSRSARRRPGTYGCGTAAGSTPAADRRTRAWRCASYGPRCRPSGSARPACGLRPPAPGTRRVPTTSSGPAARRVVDDHTLVLLLPEQVGPARVEPEGLVGGETHRGEQRPTGWRAAGRRARPRHASCAAPAVATARPCRRTAARRPAPPAPAPCCS